jgi:hypothetical protein
MVIHAVFISYFLKHLYIKKYIVYSECGFWSAVPRFRASKHPTQYQLETFINTKYDMLFQTWEETFNVDNDEKNVELA